MARPPSREPWLVFVDTNILLDFYRLRGGSSKRQLGELEAHKGSLILSEQVWMEFLKNRQRAIIDSIKEIKKPENITFPPIVSDYKQSKMTEKHVDQAVKSYRKVKTRVESILADPSHQDDVYKSVKRIFEHRGEFALSRPDKARYAVRNLARKRFILGYPPRKAGDTSIGDAVNWEWIIACAKGSADNHNVMIVSRDGDYGVTINNETYLNDWLRREFKERVSRKRKIELTQRLTVALKKLSAPVTPEDESDEAALLEKPRTYGAASLFDDALNPVLGNSSLAAGTDGADL